MREKERERGIQKDREREIARRVASRQLSGLLLPLLVCSMRLQQQRRPRGQNHRASAVFWGCVHTYIPHLNAGSAFAGKRYEYGGGTKHDRMRGKLTLYADVAHVVHVVVHSIPPLVVRLRRKNLSPTQGLKPR